MSTTHDDQLVKTIAASETVERFLNDEIIKAAIGKLEQQYYADFLEGKTPEEREAAHARATVIRDFATQLRKIADAKPIAQAELERANPERAKARRVAQQK